MDIYCTTIKYYKVMDKLPYYIKPLGLGDIKYPQNCLLLFKSNSFFGLLVYLNLLAGKIL